MPTSLLQKFLVLMLLAVAINMPTYAREHSGLTLNGIASYWILNNELYVGSLYLEQQKGTAEAIVNDTGLKRMEFRITTDKWRERNFSKTWSRAIYINNDDAISKSLSTEIIAFSNLLQGPLLYGDRVTIDYTPAKSTEVFINGTALYTTKNDDFFNALIKAWIGAKPPSSDFKKGILNLDRKNINTQDLLGRYDYIRPDLENQRNKEIADWAKVQKKTNNSVKPRPIVKKADNTPKTNVQPVVKAQSKPIIPIAIEAAAVAAPPAKASPALPLASITNTANETTVAAPTKDTAVIVLSPAAAIETNTELTATTPENAPVAITAHPNANLETATETEQGTALPSSPNTESEVESTADTADEKTVIVDALSNKAAEVVPSDNGFESILLELESKTVAD